MGENITDKNQTYYWDMNVVSMEENEAYSYYLQDDLGSPMQLLDEEGLVMETYGFDEFGVELPTDNILAVNAKRTNNLNTTGLHNNNQQPFSFTGYQMDEAGEMHFAQARRYDAEAGRFVSEDRVKGNAYNPITTNPYQYCRSHPLKYIDPTGDVYIIIWSYGRPDVEDYENRIYEQLEYSNQHSGVVCPTDAAVNYGIELETLCIDGLTDEWSDEMMDDFSNRSSFARAAYTRYDELVKMGVPEEEIIIWRVDGSEHLVEKWKEIKDFESVQMVEFYSHGASGYPIVYRGSESYFTESIGKLTNEIKWKEDKFTKTPMIYFHGCNTANDINTQNIANYFGVPVNGNIDYSSFSNYKNDYNRIDTWGTKHNVYLGVYGSDEEKILSWLFGIDCRNYGKTYYPYCIE